MDTTARETAAAALRTAGHVRCGPTFVYFDSGTTVTNCTCGWKGSNFHTHHDEAKADAALTALDSAGWLFTPEDARLMRLAIDWIASELRDQGIPPGEYVGTRTFLNGMITRFDQYAALTGSETPWAKTEDER